MESEQTIKSSLVMDGLLRHIGTLNFYRFCQWLELMYPEYPPIGTSPSPALELVHFCHWHGLGFPASEMRYLASDNPRSPPPFVVRTTFLGLYGVDGVLPYSMIVDMATNREKTAALATLFDMFHHRLLTYYYRIWSKYRHVVSFLPDATDKISRCLLCLTGRSLAVKTGRGEIPTAWWLALLGPMTQRTRTVDGVIAIVRYVLPSAEIDVQEAYIVPVRMSPVCLITESHFFGQPQCTIDPASDEFNPSTFYCSSTSFVKERVRKPLGNREALIGHCRLDSGLAIRVVITIMDPQLLFGLLPGEKLRRELMILMQGYIGWGWDVYWFVRVPVWALPDCCLGHRYVRLGMTSYIKSGTETERIELPVGRYYAQSIYPDRNYDVMSSVNINECI